jgi:hypothetical protein
METDIRTLKELIGAKSFAMVILHLLTELFLCLEYPSLVELFDYILIRNLIFIRIYLGI